MLQMLLVSVEALGAVAADFTGDGAGYARLQVVVLVVQARQWFNDRAITC